MTHRQILLDVVYIQRASCFPPLYVHGQLLIRHKLGEKGLQAEQLADEEAVLVGHTHHVGQWHEHIGGDELVRRKRAYKTARRTISPMSALAQRHTAKLSCGQPNIPPSQARTPLKKASSARKAMRFTMVATIKPTELAAPLEAASNTLVQFLKRTRVDWLGKKTQSLEKSEV